MPTFLHIPDYSHVTMTPDSELFVFTTGTYIPKKEVEVVETILATIIQPNQAIRLRARKETKVGAI